MGEQTGSMEGCGAELMRSRPGRAGSGMWEDSYFGGFGRLRISFNRPIFDGRSCCSGI